MVRFAYAGESISERRSDVKPDGNMLRVNDAFSLDVVDRLRRGELRE